MSRGKIGTPATPKTELPVIICNYGLQINIIRKKSIPDVAKTLNPSLAISMQNSPNHHAVGLQSNPKKVFPGHMCALLIKVGKFPVF